MNFLKSLPAAIACLLLGAHFLRAGQMSLVAAAIVVACIAFLGMPWSRMVVWLTLGAGIVVWCYSGWVIVNVRLAMGRPALPSALILGGVALFTFFAAWILPADDPNSGSMDPGD